MHPPTEKHRLFSPVNRCAPPAGESRICRPFENCRLYWCGVRIGMVMVNGIAIFAADLKFVYPHLAICES